MWVLGQHHCISFCKFSPPVRLLLHYLLRQLWENTTNFPPELQRLLVDFNWWLCYVKCINNAWHLSSAEVTASCPWWGPKDPPWLHQQVPGSSVLSRTVPCLISWYTAHPAVTDIVNSWNELFTAGQGTVGLPLSGHRYQHREEAFHISRFLVLDHQTASTLRVFKICFTTGTKPQLKKKKTKQKQPTVLTVVHIKKDHGLNALIMQ